MIHRQKWSNQAADIDQNLMILGIEQKMSLEAIVEAEQQCWEVVPAALVLPRVLEQVPSAARPGRTPRRGGKRRKAIGRPQMRSWRSRCSPAAAQAGQPQPGRAARHGEPLAIGEAHLRHRNEDAMGTP